MNASRFSEAQKAFTLKQGADGMLSEPCFAAKRPFGRVPTDAETPNAHR
jgi:hypothetical protein